MDQTKITLLVNGQGKNASCPNTMTLLGLLRHEMHLTSVKEGCMNGDCGACTILLNDKPVKSCLTLAVKAHKQNVDTLEGLNMNVVQEAFIRHNAFQCGYCTPGFIMNVTGLRREGTKYDEATIKDWLQSNICRCTSYQEIQEAVKDALNQRNNE